MGAGPFLEIPTRHESKESLTPLLAVQLISGALQAVGVRVVQLQPKSMILTLFDDFIDFVDVSWLTLFRSFYFKSILLVIFTITN